MIKFEDVGKRYPNGYEGLKHINLEIEQGEFVAIKRLAFQGEKDAPLRTVTAVGRDAGVLLIQFV